MRIGRPNRSSRGGEIQVSALVEGQLLWFRFPEWAGALLSDDIDPFAVAVLLVAMQRGEALELDGSISRRLAAGLAEYQRVIHGWFPERFKIVEIRPRGVREDTLLAGGAEACAFSGGVDSFYSLLTLRPRLEYALFLAGGFDMPLNLVDSIGELTRSYARMAEEMGFKLVVGSTNVRQFVNTVDWTNAHGQVLAAAALFFKGAWSRFYVPSSYTGATYPKWGTHPDLDRHLSTETMELVHHGVELNRVGKLERIAEASESHARLRVCWIQDIGLRNCGKCEKCVRTQTALEILGARGRFTTFGAFERSQIRELTMRTHQSRVFARELIGEALGRGRIGVSADLGYALLRRLIRRPWARKATAPPASR